jgi:hypothetical protein
VAEREPNDDEERLATVRPDPRPAPVHAGHDRWLVVRWTTDPTDLTPAETAQARALLAACTECAALAADLEVISRATATSVVPPRPRDFRLSPEPAVAARGGLLDRLRRWFGSQGGFAVRPLAGATLAIGLLLVVVAPALRPTVTTQGDAGPQNGRQVVMAPEATEDAPSVAKATPMEAPDRAGPESHAGTQGSPDPAADAQIMMAVSPSPSDADRTARLQLGSTEPPANPNLEQHGGASPAASATPPADDVTYVLTLLGIVLAVTGLMVLVLSWFARRWQDPLLR